MVSFKSYNALLVTVIYIGHIATAKLDCEGGMVVTGWTNSLPGCNMGLLSPCWGFLSGREGFLGSEGVFASRKC